MLVAIKPKQYSSLMKINRTFPGQNVWRARLQDKQYYFNQTLDRLHPHLGIHVKLGTGDTDETHMC